MLAALTLMILTLYFWQRKKPVLPLFIPMLCIMVIAFTSLMIKIQTFYIHGNIILLTINLIMVLLIIWMILEGILLVYQKIRDSKWKLLAFIFIFHFVKINVIIVIITVLKNEGMTWKFLLKCYSKSRGNWRSCYIWT